MFDKDGNGFITTTDLMEVHIDSYSIFSYQTGDAVNRGCFVHGGDVGGQTRLVITLCLRRWWPRLMLMEMETSTMRSLLQ